MNFKILNEIFEIFELTFYEEETIILNKNEQKNKHIIIPIEGILLNSNDNSDKKGLIWYGGKYIRSMNVNEYLGERLLFFKEKRRSTAEAKVDS